MQLGYLEETLLLLIMVMEEDIYGFSVTQAYTQHTGKSISISAVHTALSRLEKKGLIQSEMGGATDERGGRRKRMFKYTESGRSLIIQLKESREKLWAQIPDLV